MRPTVQEALSSDIHRLGGLLGQTILRLAGEEAYRLEEEVRALSKALRSNPSLEEARQLRDRLGGLKLPVLRTLIRSFSTYFDLINLAEQQARIRSLRERTVAAGESARAETPAAALRLLRERGITAEEVAEGLNRALVGPVFTAHPSEARRRTILEILAAIARQLDRLAYRELLPAEHDQTLAEITEELETIWLSETIRATRPTVLDEVRQSAGLVEGRLLEVVPRVYRNLEDALQTIYPERSWHVPSFLRFGSWIGGDRDGHPNVTHQVTNEALRFQRETILREYLTRVDDLWRRLSHSDRFVRPGPALRASLERDAAQFPDVAIVPEHEPYRAKCRMIAARLRRTLDHARTHVPDWSRETYQSPSGVYHDPQGLLDDLTLIADDLRQTGARPPRRRWRDPRPDPAGRGLRPPHDDDRPPAA